MLKKLNSIEKYLGGVLFLFIVILAFMQVFLRYVLETSVAWTEESSLFLFVWFIYLGASACTAENKHVCVEMFVNALPKRPQLVLGIIMNLCWLAFCILIFYTAMQVTIMNAQRGSSTMGANLPYAVGMAAVPVGMVLMALRVIQNMVKLVRPEGKMSKEEEMPS